MAKCPPEARAPSARVTSVPLLRCLLSAQLSQSSDVHFDKNPRSELFVLQQRVSKGGQTLAAPSLVPSSSSSSLCNFPQQGWDLSGGCDLHNKGDLWGCCYSCLAFGALQPWGTPCTSMACSQSLIPEALDAFGIG